MGGKHVAGRHNRREKGMSASAQDGAGMCTTPMPQPLTTLACIAKKRHLPNQTHSLWRRIHNTGGKSVVGDTTQDRKECQQVHKMGAVMSTTPMPKPLTQPSHAPPTKALATPNSPTAAKEA